MRLRDHVLLVDDSPGFSQFLGEEDARVLNLAEQIIAALPERIKRTEGDGPFHSSPPPPPPPPLSPLEDALMEQMVNLHSYYHG